MRYLLLLLVLMAGCTQVSPVYKQDINTAYLQLLHNKERGQRDLPQLQYDKELEAFAQKWAEHMASRGSLRHSNLGFSGNMKGENIAMGQKDEDAVTKAWMSSRGHRANILNSKFTHAGFGCARTERGTLYWCACFCSRS